MRSNGFQYGALIVLSGSNNEVRHRWDQQVYFINIIVLFGVRMHSHEEYVYRTVLFENVVLIYYFRTDLFENRDLIYQFEQFLHNFL